MEQWEMAVDAISDAVYEALKRNAMYEEAEGMLHGWMTTLNALFADFSDQTTADFDEEVLEVVSTVLRACSDQQWRSKDNAEGDVYSQSIFTSSFLCNITNSAHRLIRKNSYCEGLRTTLGGDYRPALQRELGQYVNAKLYWTPPNQQGFKIPIDDHCGE
ncbi:hypothetical protein Poli38472_000338 [Pythium oligandrum]|uniref:Uncharacterized protein n=1 Tax=Pythium oligandrum TaxID=41045 RepID=A0A8K1CCA2_PYTOL|nr:hypothetical protein Poli38472_000338 [Pythium oligandrum]|eukprot:TMW60296.1 hypothetical protein Poli38472_000338 [Pythium oligandrum]